MMSVAVNKLVYNPSNKIYIGIAISLTKRALDLLS